jgi:hypothetical protein
MRPIYAFRRQMCVYIVLFVAIGASVLAGCGTNSSGTGATGGTGTTATPSPMPTSETIRGYGTAYGCPSDVVVSNSPATANITVRPGQGQTTFSVHTGDVMEIQMPFGIAWRGPTAPVEVLQLQSPSGYVWKPSNACIWRFVARGAGKVKLTFEGMALCKKVPLCVPSVEIAEFTVQVA